MKWDQFVCTKIEGLFHNMWSKSYPLIQVNQNFPYLETLLQDKLTDKIVATHM